MKFRRFFKGGIGTDEALIKRLSAVTDEEKLLLAGDSVSLRDYFSGRQRVIDAARMLERGELIRVRPHTRFAEFPEHSHNYIEMVYMCSGQTTHVINGEEELTLGTGELLILNSRARHLIRRAGMEDVAVNIIVLPEFFDTALSMSGRDNILADLLLDDPRRNGGVSYLHFRAAGLLPVRNTIESLIWGVLNRQGGDGRILQVTMGLLFMQLASFAGQMRMPSAAGGEMVSAVARDIEENFRASSLSALADGFGVSAAYLSRCVREATGHTYKQLLMRRRLCRACELLETTRLPVREICAEVGYDNSSYFHNIFRLRYGVTPAEWRDRLNKDAAL